MPKVCPVFLLKQMKSYAKVKNSYANKPRRILGLHKLELFAKSLCLNITYSNQGQGIITEKDSIIVVLNRLGVKEMAMIKANAICCKQNNSTFYVTVVNSDVLKKMCYVSRKKENREKGFQRLLNPKRARDIAAYLDERRGKIPSAIIVSAQLNTKLSYNKEDNTISFNVVEDGFLVIDGQHRLYGLIESNNIYEMPVIIFNDLNSNDEVKLFIDINTTQKGVPAALILDIKNQAGTETKLEERQRILFDRLNEESVLAGYLLPNESKTGKISRTVFNSSTKNLFTDSIIFDKTDDVIFKVLCNYFEAVDLVFKSTGNKNARLNKTILFKAIMDIFNDVSERCYNTFNNFKVDSFFEILSPLSSLSFDSYTGTNKAAQKEVVNDMKALLRDTMTINEDMF